VSPRVATQKPSAGIVDSQSVKGADTVPAASRGFDAAEINGRKRHIVVDTIGLMLVVMVTAPPSRTATAGRASSSACTERSVGPPYFSPMVGYQGALIELAKRSWKIVVEVVKETSRADRLRGASTALGRGENVLLALALAAPGA